MKAPAVTHVPRAKLRAGSETGVYVKHDQRTRPGACNGPNLDPQK
jgi:hypothetical protein